MIHVMSFQGRVTDIRDFPVGVKSEESGCYKLMTVVDRQGSIANFIISPNTYFTDHALVSVNDQVTGYYDGNAPMPLIYPPQYQMIIVVREIFSQIVKVDFFNENLLSSDGQLQLNLARSTPILLANDQPFSMFPGNRNLIVFYDRSTRSIPAQTTPHKIVVWCS